MSAPRPPVTAADPPRGYGPAEVHKVGLFVAHGGPALGPHRALAHVSLEIEMLGNFDEKSLARCAIFTAIWRATLL